MNRRQHQVTETDLRRLQDCLRPALALEHAGGYAHRSPVGGLGTLGLGWARDAARARVDPELIETVTELLGLYNRCERPLRALIADALWQWCEEGVLHIPALDEAQQTDELFAVMSMDNHSTAMVPQGAAPDDSVKVLRGIGNALAARLDNLGIQTLSDLLFHFPHRYETFQNLRLEQIEAGQTVSVMGRLCPKSLHRFRFGRQVHKSGVRARIRDGTDEVDITWWNRWVWSSLQEGGLYHFYGKVEQYNGRRLLSNPQFVPLTVQTVKRNMQLAAQNQLPQHAIMALYPLTEGITQAFLRKVIGALLAARLHQQLDDELPLEIRNRFELPSIRAVMALLHQPAAQLDWRRGHQRLAFQSLHRLHTGLQAVRAERRTLRAPALPMPDTYVADYDAALPFTLTPEQDASLRDILADIAQDRPACRLLRGEAGCGKTVVVAAAMLAAARHGLQAALVAPTQILARQHLESMLALVDRIPGSEEGFPVRVDLLTGAQSEEEKRAVRQRIASGQAQIVIGTTALIQPNVHFACLGLLIVDEEHRFSVDQRQALARPWSWDGADSTGMQVSPHMISLSATPIPRSLNQILTGYLDVSEIRARPARRLPVRTLLRQPAQRLQIFKTLRREVAQGRQGFIVYPQIDMADEFTALGSVEPEFVWLAQDIFPELRLDKVHGRMTKAEVEEVMQRFKDGAVDILVSTTVIEVGIDVPNASMMIIENAERFGLAQLHQLRNRVGRGDIQGTCILMCSSAHGQAQERLSPLIESDSGFEIAERDLALRGPGELLGKRQSGMPEIPYTDYLDQDVMDMIAACFEDLRPPGGPEAQEGTGMTAGNGPASVQDTLFDAG